MDRSSDFLDGLGASGDRGRRLEANAAHPDGLLDAYWQSRTARGWGRVRNRAGAVDGERHVETLRRDSLNQRVVAVREAGWIASTGLARQGRRVRLGNGDVEVALLQALARACQTQSCAFISLFR